MEFSSHCGYFPVSWYDWCIYCLCLLVLHDFLFLHSWALFWYTVTWKEFDHFNPILSLPFSLGLILHQCKTLLSTLADALWIMRLFFFCPLKRGTIHSPKWVSRIVSFDSSGWFPPLVGVSLHTCADQYLADD